MNKISELLFEGSMQFFIPEFLDLLAADGHKLILGVNLVGLLALFILLKKICNALGRLL